MMSKNTDDRFQEDSGVALAFGVVAMHPLSSLSAEEQAAYGIKELQILTDFYGQRAQRGDGQSANLRLRKINAWKSGLTVRKA